VYEQTSALVLTGAQDSGASSSPIIYRAYPGEAPRLSGGKQLDPSWFSLVTSALPVWSRLDPAAQGNRTIYLTWKVNVTLPTTSTWRIDYGSQTGTAYLPITDIISPMRAYTLTGLTNYAWYTVTLHAMLGETSWLSDTVWAMPTDRFVYLPLVLRGQ